MSELERYGALVIKYLEEKGQEALLILSRASTTHMFREYSDFFEEVESDGEIKIALKNDKSLEDLKAQFRTYIAIDVLKAFIETWPNFIRG